eukprot:GHVR01125424.1.p1 GENE.GHVR01125424.1~~GHVR01125424.1.p1  ORF type:complete len:436 (+),score=55.89 GHVR01125424.1:129-1310(+)
MKVMDCVFDPNEDIIKIVNDIDIYEIKAYFKDTLMYKTGCKKDKRKALRVKKKPFFYLLRKKSKETGQNQSVTYVCKHKDNGRVKSVTIQFNSIPPTSKYSRITTKRASITKRAYIQHSCKIGVSGINFVDERSMFYNKVFKFSKPRDEMKESVINVTIIDKDQFTPSPFVEGMVEFNVDNAWRRSEKSGKFDKDDLYAFDMSKQKTYLTTDKLGALENILFDQDATSSALIRVSMEYIISGDRVLLSFIPHDIGGTDYRANQLIKCLQNIQMMCVNFDIHTSKYTDIHEIVDEIKMSGPLVDKYLLEKLILQVDTNRKSNTSLNKGEFIDPILYHVSKDRFNYFGSKLFEDMSFNDEYDFLYFYYDEKRTYKRNKFKIIAKVEMKKSEKLES